MGGFPDEKTAPPNYEASELPSTSSSSAFQSQFASISLHLTDRIRFLQFPLEVVDTIRPVVAKTWPKGIQEERSFGGSHEIKVHGYPWVVTDNESILAQDLMKEMFACLFSMGWILHQPVELSKKGEDRDTLVFRKQPSPPPESLWFSISFVRTDRLRLIGAPQELILAFREMLNSLKMLQSESSKAQRVEFLEFKLMGYPWYPSGEETMKMRLLILRMLELLEMHGWSLYASYAHISTEADGWYLVKQADWLPGNPVFHR